MSTGPSYFPDHSFTMFSGGPEPCRGAIGCSHKHGIVGSGTGHCCSLCTGQAGHQTDQCCSGGTACTGCIRSHGRSPCTERRSISQTQSKVELSHPRTSEPFNSFCFMFPDRLLKLRRLRFSGPAAGVSMRCSACSHGEMGCASRSA